MANTTGATIIAQALKSQGVDILFGIVGIPVVEACFSFPNWPIFLFLTFTGRQVAEACSAQGIKYIGFRNEQSASYAASAYGFLTGKPGVCLTVGGPGVVHGLAGLANAKPMVMLAGSSDTHEQGSGAFQELDQVEVCRSFTKYATRPTSISKIPFVVEKAFRTALYGRPGASYIDLPGDYIQGGIPTSKATALIASVPTVADPPISLADPKSIASAIDLLRGASHPLIIVGKGASYSRAEKEVLQLIEKTNIPFLPTPMGKGLVPDIHPLCVAAARSKAIAEADVVLLLGARLNWILHFGSAPRFNHSVKFIQVDIHPEESSGNLTPAVSLTGHLPAVLSQLLSHPSLPSFPPTAPFLTALRQKVDENVRKTEQLGRRATVPMTYHTAFWEIKRNLPSKGIVFVSEGANTLDIARTVFDVNEPRCRVDSGTFATMGVGMGYAIAAQVVYPDKRVVSIVGDSAFGFSAMELETAARANLPLIILVINNNGIYNGLDGTEYTQSRSDDTLPSTALSVDTRYDVIAEACGGRGWFVRTTEELGAAVRAAMVETSKTCVINVAIVPGGRKKLEFAWQTKTEAKL
ncbi:hypothetical protein BC937DRAFT_86136 [Endogone sp. FLAS-F59071]|nr:hypothetical protein BC937DRAFT_86136 [Endogone sp. FLAS-F59071]|eukprot:RUS23451.1 hypothetical protein BC937DRAFT_86136 [Endogone sp. FLAS-F59071]